MLVIIIFLGYFFKFFYCPFLPFCFSYALFVIVVVVVIGVRGLNYTNIDIVAAFISVPSIHHSRTGLKKMDNGTAEVTLFCIVCIF